MGGGMLAQVESENVWGWFKHAAEDVADTVTGAADEAVGAL